MNVCPLFWLWWHTLTWWAAKTSFWALSQASICEMEPEGSAQFPVRFMGPLNGFNKKEKVNTTMSNKINSDIEKPYLPYHTTIVGMKEWIYRTDISFKNSDRTIKKQIKQIGL